jgi:hypothetical protein
MAAVMVEQPSTQWRGLEPEGRGHELMITWGRHRRGGDRTRSPVSSGSWDERLDPVHEDEPPCVVAVDDILRGLVRSGHHDAVEIAKVFYLEHPKYAVWQVAAKVYRTEGFVRLSLRGLCALVEERVTE